MGDSSGQLCSYFAQGACRFGDSCRFSHDRSAPAQNVCRFYLKGNCSFGDRCRYDHVRPSGMKPAPHARAPPPAVPRPPVDAMAGMSLGGGGGRGGGHLNAGAAVWRPNPNSAVWAGATARGLDIELPDELDLSPEMLMDSEEFLNDFEDFVGGGGGGPEEAGIVDDDGPTDEELAEFEEFMRQGGGKGGGKPLCQAFVRGSCGRGDACPHAHGQLCPTCQRPCLHPDNASEREDHLSECGAKFEAERAMEASRAIECSICLEVVLQKPRLADRRFGILDGCDHPFCLGCIRGWRSGTDGGLSLEGAVRTCPVCRTRSNFVIPSTTWTDTKEGREKLAAAYKGKCKGIPCKHFDFGDGQCPFGTSCFFRHAYRDGTVEETRLRHYEGGEGVSIAKPVRLADFLEGHM